jgi:hypothetical protein
MNTTVVLTWKSVRKAENSNLYREKRALLKSVIDTDTAPYATHELAFEKRSLVRLTSENLVWMEEGRPSGCFVSLAAFARAWKKARSLVTEGAAVFLLPTSSPLPLSLPTPTLP